MHIDTDFLLEKLEARAKEFVKKYDVKRGSVDTAPRGRNLLNSIKQMLKQSELFRQADAELRKPQGDEPLHSTTN